MENMELWNRVCTTDPAHTKKINARGGFTAIDAQYQRLEATKVFGPYGVGWGLMDLEWNYIGLAEKPIERTLDAVFWYMLDDAMMDVKVFRFEISVDAAYKSGDDQKKKMQTDAITKALSYLGFNADVFLGKFDDNKYVAEQEQAHKKKPAPKLEDLGLTLSNLAAKEMQDNVRLEKLQQIKDRWEIACHDSGAGPEEGLALISLATIAVIGEKVDGPKLPKGKI